MRRKFASCVLGLAVLLPAGCSGKDRQQERPEPVAAAGTVTYKRKPVAEATVNFLSLDGSVSATGTTDSAGRFVLSTYGERDGAPPGQYRVVVSVGTAKEVEPGVLAPEPEGGWKSPIPTRYADPDGSDLVVEVPQGGKSDIAVELK